jgi:hypothetical protein
MKTSPHTKQTKSSTAKRLTQKFRTHAHTARLCLSLLLRVKRSGVTGALAAAANYFDCGRRHSSLGVFPNDAQPGRSPCRSLHPQYTCLTMRSGAGNLGSAANFLLLQMMPNFYSTNIFSHNLEKKKYL